MAFNIYQPKSNAPVRVNAQDMIRNQKILNGTNPELEAERGIFFLDTLIVSSGVEITDWDGNSIGSGITSFQLNNNHIRLDGGIKITGAVIMAKGYVIQGVIES